MLQIIFLAMINIQSFVFNPVQVNSFVLWDEETKECVLIDPACWNEQEQNQLTTFVEQNELKVVRIVNTHEHFDHVWGNKFAADTYNVPLTGHKDGETILANAVNSAQSFGLTMDPPPPFSAHVEDGETITFGNSSLEVIHVPGHAPGSIVLYSEAQGFMICGDVLFKGSIGRTDLPMGNQKTLVDGIKAKLLVKPEETVVFSGHGPSSTIGFEKKNNPYLY